MKLELPTCFVLRAIEPLELRIAPATLFGLDNANRLITFDSDSPGNTGAPITVTGLGPGEILLGIDFRPATGALYGVTVDGVNTGRIYAIDPVSGAAAFSATLSADPTDITSPYTSLSGANFGLDFNPAADRLRLVSDAEQNLRVNVDTGFVVTDSPITPNSAISSAAHTSNFAGATSTALYEVDTTTDTLVLQNPPDNGTLTTVGALGVNVTGVGGFEIASIRSANGTEMSLGLAALTVGDATGLYSINLVTGAATLIGAIGFGNIPLRGLTASTGTPSASAFTIDASNHLYSFNTATPNLTVDIGAVTGLGNGESIIGFDFRPANGVLILVTKNALNVGRLYSLNTTTAVATALATLSADPSDTSSPFTALNGTSFGVDFNPQTDRLRIVSETGQNLRIAADTGTVITDQPLEGLSSAIIGAAYINNFHATSSTTLYTLASAGNLQIDATTLGGFDIRANNQAYATLTVGGVASLYSINLDNGAPTLVGQVGTGTSTLGLALVPNGTLQFSANGAAVPEFAGNATLTVHRVGGADGTVSVVVRTGNGTALAGSDYTAVARVITFAPGVTSQTISIPVIDDIAEEGPEALLATLSNANGGAALNNLNAAAVTILDNEATPSITIADVSEAERNAGLTAFNFRVQLSAAFANDVTVDFTTVTGTASAGADFTAAAGTITIPAGQTFAFIPIPVSGDNVAESNETFSVVLSNPANATIADDTGLGTILNDDVNVVNTRQVTFTDVDGDLVTIKITKGKLEAADFILKPGGNVGGQQLLAINLADQEFKNTNVSVSAKRTSLGGDGYVNIGFLEATGITLGNVAIDGDLGQIDAASIKRLAVHSMGLFGLTTQSTGGSLVSNISGDIGNLSVLTDILKASIVAGGNIGPVKVGGDIIGGTEDHSGSIEAGGRITNVNVFGDLVGGDGLASGSVIAQTAGPIKIRGDLEGGSILIAGTNSHASQRAALALTSLAIAGNLESSQILIGYDRDALPVNGNVATGAIRVGGYAAKSNIVAGIDAGTDGLFGTDDDSLIDGANTKIISRIASITIVGQALGTVEDQDDAFSFTAEQIGSFQVGRTKLTFKSTTTESFAIGTTGDLTAREVVG